MMSALKRCFGLTRTEESAIMTVAEMKALRKDVDTVEFKHRIWLHSKELFDLNEHDFFDGFKFIKSELLEDAIVDDSNIKKDVIVYKCEKLDEGYDYNITVSFEGSVMFGRKIVNIFKHARFGDKCMTEIGDVVIYGNRMDTTYVGGHAINSHFLMSKFKVFYVYDDGEFIGARDSRIDSNVVGRLGEEDLDIVKAYVKKELSEKDVDGYMQGFIDGYNNSVIL